MLQNNCTQNAISIGMATGTDNIGITAATFSFIMAGISASGTVLFSTLDTMQQLSYVGYVNANLPLNT